MGSFIPFFEPAVLSGQNMLIAKWMSFLTGVGELLSRHLRILLSVFWHAFVKCCFTRLHCETTTSCWFVQVFFFLLDKFLPIHLLCLNGTNAKGIYKSKNTGQVYWAELKFVVELLLCLNPEQTNKSVELRQRCWTGTERWWVSKRC